MHYRFTVLLIIISAKICAQQIPCSYFVDSLHDSAGSVSYFSKGNLRFIPGDFMRVEMSFARIDSSFVITLKSTSDLAIHEDQKIQFFLKNKKVIDISSGGTHNGETKYSLQGKFVLSAKILGSDLIKKIRLWHASGKMDFELDFWQSASFQETIKCMTNDL